MFCAVIFDWDETLADTRKAVVTSFQQVLQQIGCDVSDEFIEKRIGIGARNTFKEALEATKMRFNDTMLEELVKEKVKRQVELSEKVELFEGSLELLESLHGKIRIGLASMNNKEVIDNLLSKKGLADCFDIIVTADDVLQPKPDPEIFLKCAAKLNCQPKKCVVLEDSIFGVKAAKAANMKCIALPTGAYSREELEREKPNSVVDSMKEWQTIQRFILEGT